MTFFMLILGWWAILTMGEKCPACLASHRERVQLQPTAVANILNKHRNRERMFYFSKYEFLHDHFANNLPGPFIGNGMRERRVGERGSS